MINPDAVQFLEALAERANASDVLDAPWWMALADMLNDGWEILPPKEAR